MDGIGGIGLRKVYGWIDDQTDKRMDETDRQTGRYG
jgi:hypothetical protein